MSQFTPLIAVHAIAALLALTLGPVQILRPRRDRAHKVIGGTWVLAMLGVIGTSFGIHPHGFSPLHGLSLFTLCTVSLGVVAAHTGRIRLHRANMIGSWFGLLGAFIFAVVVPSRAIPVLVRTDPVLAYAVLAAVLVVAATWVVGSIVLLGRPSRPGVPGGRGTPRVTQSV